MFAHPVAVCGYILIAIGLFLALATGEFSTIGQFRAFAVSTACFSLGGFLVLLGVIAGGFDQVVKTLGHHPAIAAGLQMQAEAERAELNAMLTGSNSGESISYSEAIRRQAAERRQEQ